VVSFVGRGLIFWSILPIAVAVLAVPSGPAVDTPECKSRHGIDRICGIPVPEDLAAIPDTPWIISSSMPRDGSAGGLYLIDTRTHMVRKVEFAIAAGQFGSGEDEAKEVGQCAPPDTDRFITHGLSLSAGEGVLHRLYVVGHGGREAIELFNVDASGDVPSISWTGCVPMPEGLEANSVVGLPGGGLMFTSLYDPGETAWPARIGKLASGAPAGGVFEWHVRSGLKQLSIPPMSGPNGIAVSRDGKSIFLAGWGDRIVRRLDRNGNETAQPMKLDFLPDNLHWAPDGSLFASGQKIAVGDLFACSIRKDGPTYCAHSWDVVRIEPSDLSMRAHWRRETENFFGDSTSAITIEGELWIGSISGDCLAVVAPLGPIAETAGSEQPAAAGEIK